MLFLVVLLLIANVINIGADLAAMGDAAQLSTGLSAHVLTVGFALVSLLLQLFIPYERYARLLKWLTLSLLAYVAVVLLVRIDWGGVALGLVRPRVERGAGATTIVAIFGTTISPYLFFWQSAQEIENVKEKKGARPLRQAPWQAGRELRRIRLDTYVGMAASNLVALAIIIAAAATLHAQGTLSIGTAADAARALQPAAGRFAFLLFSLGILGTGLLAVPALAGSAAFAVCDANGWTCGLEHKPREAVGFYAVIVGATLIGVGIDWSPIEPIRALFWSAVINGVAAVPIMAAMMVVVSRRKLMGKFAAPLPLKIIGWSATAIMAAAALAMLVV